jgi:hypothetical protein
MEQPLSRAVVIGDAGEAGKNQDQKGNTRQKIWMKTLYR